MNLSIELDRQQYDTICKALAYGAISIERLPIVKGKAGRDMQDMVVLLLMIAGSVSTLSYCKYVERRLGKRKTPRETST